MEFVPTWFGVRMPEYSEWTASLNVDLIFYFKMDEESGSTTFDSLGLHNGTITGATINQTGIISRAYNFSNSGVHRVVTTQYFMPNGTADRTINFWANPNDAIDNHHYFAYGNMANGEYFALRPLSAGKLAFMGNVQDVVSNHSIQIGVWQMFTVTYNGSQLKMYANATLVFDGPLTLNTQAICSSCVSNSGTDKFSLALFTGVSSLGYVGQLDEFSAWNRTLNSTEITQLYNDGNAISFVPNPIPNVTIIFPENITFIVPQTQLNFTVDAVGVRCWFSIDGGITNSSDNDCTTNFTVSPPSVFGGNTWIVFSNSSNGDVGFDSVTFTFGKFTQNSSTFNPFVFETSEQSYIINITTNGTDSPSSTNLIYNGTNKGSGAIINTGGNDFNISKTIDVPLGTGNNTWFFNVTTGGVEESSPINQQRVAAINLTVCQNAPQDIPYINLTFTNETVNQEDVTASITTSVWTYFLGSGTVNKTLNYANATEAFNYTFCFSPSNQTLSSTLDIAYTNPISEKVAV